VFAADREVTNESTAALLRNVMNEFQDHAERVLPVRPR
jgi:hypothetical protein